MLAFLPPLANPSRALFKRINEVMRKQQGFTLIELIMVVVVLGILSAFALPRFVDFSGQASAAALDGALGSVKASSAIAHASCLADAACNTAVANSSTDMEGTIDMDFGYPGADDTTSGIVAAANLDGYGLTRSATVDGTHPGLIITNNDTLINGDACVFYVAASYDSANDILTPPATGIGVVDITDTNPTCIN